MDVHWFDQLEGHWQMRRRILDLSGDAAPTSLALSGHLVGVATFTRLDAVSMAYVESGDLVLRDGTRLKAVRRYLYRLEDDGACVIDFADGPDKGRRFLRFADALSETPFEGNADAAGGVSNGDWTVADDHLCGRDLYQVQYRFLGFKAGPSWNQAREQAGGKTLEQDDGKTLEQAGDQAHEQTKKPAGGKQLLLQRTVVSGPRKDYAIVSRLQR